MAKSDTENLINIQSITQFQNESNPPPISPTNPHENFTFKIDENSLDSEIVVADLKNKIIGAQNEVEDVETKEETGAVMELVNVEKSDNAVLRKLLRVSRYFDPPDNNWGNCSNCSGTGHTVANCTAVKRKKPCYVCGSLQHIPKNCKKGRICANCKQGGHRARNCPEKSAEGIPKTKLCLKCGDSGHDMLTCRTAYSPDDLKEIRCYMCKCFGHLCCVDYGRELGVVSCYTCGQLGHTGSECTRSSAQPHEKTTNSTSPSLCKKCGEEGHTARKCKTYVKQCTRSSAQLNEETTNTTSPSLCKKCGEEGHTTTKCKTYVKRTRRSRRRRLKEKNDDLGVNSAPHELNESRKRIKTENGSSNSSQPKRRGGWIDEEHGGHQNGTQWGSPSTPVTYKPKNSFHDIHYPPRYQFEASGSNGHHQHNFSASRLGNSSSHERKEYSWDC